MKSEATLHFRNDFQGRHAADIGAPIVTLVKEESADGTKSSTTSGVVVTPVTLPKEDPRGTREQCAHCGKWLLRLGKHLKNTTTMGTVCVMSVLGALIYLILYLYDSVQRRLLA